MSLVDSLRDPRVAEILRLVRELGETCAPPRDRVTESAAVASEPGDLIDSILRELRATTSRVRERMNVYSDHDERAQEAMNVVFGLASLDFSRRATVHEDGSAFDGVAAGLNMLSEELEAATSALVARTTELRDQKAVLESILESMADGVLVVDTDRKLLVFNRAASRILESGPPTGDGPAAWAAACGLVSPDGGSLPPDALALPRGLRGESSDDVELRVLRPGVDRFIHLTGRPLVGENGVVRGALVVFRDVTERRRAELERQRLAALVESSEDAIIGYDTDARITSWNRGAERLYGYAAAEVLGSSELVIVPEEEQALVESVVESMRKGGGAVHHETVRRRKDGSRVEIALTVSPIRDGAGTLVGMAAIARDITARRQSDEALRAAKEAAESATRAKSEFLANMSHEIRTPMNGVIGMTELVLATRLTREQREYLEMVRSSADSLLDVINGILDFSKIEAGRMELDPEPFNVRESLGDTIRTLSVRAHERGIELLCDFGPDVPEEIVGDVGRLRQVLVNLAGNAIKFTERGEVFVSIERAPAAEGEVALAFSVEDTGVGIPRDRQSTIFDPFRQADSSTTRRFGGTGLGLSIASQIVRMMGGKLEVESAPGEGSRFFFTARFGAVTRSEPRALRARLDDLRGLPILVVDDNATNRRILVGMLRGWSMAPSAVDGGLPALEQIARARREGRAYPLILLDANMPDMDGFALAERILADPTFTGATIMMLSSGMTVAEAERCRALGIAVYLVKPVKQSELLDAILVALGATSSPASERLTTPSPPAARLRVLVAEDNRVNQVLVRRLLEKEGHEVVVVTSGIAAVALTARERFDAVLMDIQMPEMSGIDATIAIRERERRNGGHVPIVALTAHAQQSDREACLTAGMDGYLSKPVRPQELYQAIFAATAPPSEPGPATVKADDALIAGMLERVEGDAELLAELAGILLADAPRLIAELRAARETRDGYRLGRVAHTLGGAVALFGVEAVAVAARRIEALALGGELGAAAAAVEEAIRELESLCSILAPIASGGLGGVG